LGIDLAVVKNRPILSPSTPAGRRRHNPYESLGITAQFFERFTRRPALSDCHGAVTVRLSGCFGHALLAFRPMAKSLWVRLKRLLKRGEVTEARDVGVDEPEEIVVKSAFENEPDIVIRKEEP
jgi:hypothetical protein